jgi:hypothetical protein
MTYLPPADVHVYTRNAGTENSIAKLDSAGCGESVYWEWGNEICRIQRRQDPVPQDSVENMYLSSIRKSKCTGAAFVYATLGISGDACTGKEGIIGLVCPCCRNWFFGIHHGGVGSRTHGRCVDTSWFTFVSCNYYDIKWSGGRVRVYHGREGTTTTTMMCLVLSACMNEDTCTYNVVVILDVD